MFLTKFKKSLTTIGLTGALLFGASAQAFVYCKGDVHSVIVGNSGSQENYLFVRLTDANAVSRDFRLGLASDPVARAKFDLAVAIDNKNRYMSLMFYSESTCDAASANRTTPTSGKLIPNLNS